MSRLTKDFARVIVSRLYENSGGAYPTTTVLSESIRTVGSVSGTIPVIAAYPTTVTDPIGRGIRVCSAAEVAALKAERFGGLAEPMASTELTQLLYRGDYGTPLKVYPSGDYIAAWYSVPGLGFHYFVGYDYADPPTQEIDVSALQQVR